MWLALWFKSPQGSLHADIDRGGFERVNFRARPVLAQYSVFGSVLHTADSPRQANFEMLSVHLLGFTVTGEIP